MWESNRVWCATVPLYVQKKTNNHTYSIAQTVYTAHTPHIQQTQQTQMKQSDRNIEENGVRCDYGVHSFECNKKTLNPVLCVPYTTLSAFLSFHHWIGCIRKSRRYAKYKIIVIIYSIVDDVLWMYCFACEPNERERMRARESERVFWSFFSKRLNVLCLFSNEMISHTRRHWWEKERVLFFYSVAYIL